MRFTSNGRYYDRFGGKPLLLRKSCLFPMGNGLNLGQLRYIVWNCGYFECVKKPILF